MGRTISGIIVDNLPGHTANPDSWTPEKPTYEISRTTGLSPRRLSIGFHSGASFVFLDQIFVENINEQVELTALEQDIVHIFPKSKILVIAISDTADITGYSLIRNGVKVRTKCVVAGKGFLDYGDLNDLEIKLLKQIDVYINAKPVVLTKIRQHTKNMTLLQKQKFHLIYRDKLLSRNNKENPFAYLGGGLDRYIIDSECQAIVQGDFNEIERSHCVVFEKGELNYPGDSLSPYIDQAYHVLHSK